MSNHSQSPTTGSQVEGTDPATSPLRFTYAMLQYQPYLELRKIRDQLDNSRCMLRFLIPTVADREVSDLVEKAWRSTGNYQSQIEVAVRLLKRVDTDWVKHPSGNYPSFCLMIPDLTDRYVNVARQLKEANNRIWTNMWNQLQESSRAAALSEVKEKIHVATSNINSISILPSLIVTNGRTRFSHDNTIPEQLKFATTATHDLDLARELLLKKAEHQKEHLARIGELCNEFYKRWVWQYQRPYSLDPGDVTDDENKAFSAELEGPGMLIGQLALLDEIEQSHKVFLDG